MTDVTADDIDQYLNARDDFDLELFAYRQLQGHGFQADHGGTYIDPYTQKPRQYDVWARKHFNLQCDLFTTVECKSLSLEAPLIVSRVPRADDHVAFDMLKTWWRPENGSMGIEVESSDPTRLTLYPAGDMVGKARADGQAGQPDRDEHPR
jgi:hypothetical protein